MEMCYYDRHVNSTGKGPPKCKYLAYQSAEVRRLSFCEAPEYLVTLSQKLADNGYFYAGYSNKTTCFTCGYSCNSWTELDEDPYQKHLAENPNCAYIQLKKQLLELSSQPKPRPPPEKRQLVNSKYPEYASPILRQQSFGECGGFLKKKAVLYVEAGLFYIGFGTHVGCFHCGKQFSIEEHEEPVAKHFEENSSCDFIINEKYRLDENAEKIRHQLMCKVCLDAQVAVTFRPCGHLATCHACASRLDTCPVCRSKIQQKMNTYF